MPASGLQSKFGFCNGLRFPGFARSTGLRLSTARETNRTTRGHERTQLGRTNWVEPDGPNQCGPNLWAEPQTRTTALKRSAPIAHHTLSAMEVVL